MRQLHNNLYVAGQITAAEIAELARQGVKLIINNRPDGEELTQLPHEQAAQIAAEHGIEYRYLPMANGQPLPPNLVTEFRAALEQESGAILAHCRSGMRSSVIWALGAIAANEISVDEAISQGVAAGIPLQNARALLESVQISD